MQTGASTVQWKQKADGNTQSRTEVTLGVPALPFALNTPVGGSAKVINFPKPEYAPREYAIAS